VEITKSRKVVVIDGVAIYGSLRFAAWRSGGFLAQMFNRRTTTEPAITPNRC